MVGEGNAKVFTERQGKIDVLKLLYILYKMKLLSPLTLLRLTAAVYRYGINLMTLLNFSARTYGEKLALVDEGESLTYHQLFTQADELCAVLQTRYQLTRGQKAGLACSNHASLVKAIFAVSSSGADVYLLPAKTSEGQFQRLLQQHDFDLLICDEEQSHWLGDFPSEKMLLSYHETLPAINSLCFGSEHERTKPQRMSAGKLVLLTGGTTGKAKEARHKPSLFHYLDPFFAFLTRLNILPCHTAYIATPIYHGYGVAVLLLFMALGKKVVIQQGFDPVKACRLIREHQVEVVTVVPLMLHKMLRTNAADLKSLVCIASGGAELNPKLVKETAEQLGAVLYNLYGTSEAGLNIIATPQDLGYSARTIGRKIEGVRIKIVDEHQREVAVGQPGQLCIQNKWSMKNRSRAWIETGDVGYRDEKGYYFLCGRTDSMIVSAGVNLYPLEVEQILLTHPHVEDAAVIGVPDELYGQRLQAYILLAPQAVMTAEEMFAWLSPRLARYQQPKEVLFVDRLPYTHLGKVDRKLLLQYGSNGDMESSGSFRRC